MRLDLECKRPSDLSGKGLIVGTVCFCDLHARLQNLDPVCTGLALVVAIGRRMRLEKPQPWYRHSGGDPRDIC